MSLIPKFYLLCFSISASFSYSAFATYDDLEAVSYPSPFTVTQTNINIFDLPLNGNSRIWQINEKDSKELSVTLNEVMLPKGAWIEVSDISGERKEIYNQKSLYDGSKPQIITPSVEGGGITIRLITPDDTPHAGSLIVNQYSYIKIKKIEEHVIIGDNQMKHAACYESINPDFFAKSNAIVKANGSSGWNIVGGNYVVTNHHVAGGVGNKIHNLHYNYQNSSCTKRDPLNILSLKTESVVVASNGSGMDMSVYKVDPLGYEEAGIKQIFGTLAIDSELPKSELVKSLPVYIAQHPWGDYKRISSLHDDGGPCHTLSGGGEKVLRYNCDTAGGSSGSPVLRQDDNRVVALHYGGAKKYNVGTLSSDVYRAVESLIPSSNKPEEAVIGEGKAIVRHLNIFPFMPPAAIDLGVESAIKLTSLYENRLKHEQNSTLFKARGRVSGGDIVDTNVRLSLKTPCGTTNLIESEYCSLPGKRYLSGIILEKDNPNLKSLSGWITLQVSDTQGQRLRNLILPLSYDKYDPFVSPFPDGAQVKKYSFTGDKTLTTDMISYNDNFGFVAVYGGQGPLNIASPKEEYTMLKVHVKNKNDGEVYIISLRGNRKINCSPSLRPINTIGACGDVKPASLVLSYHPEDNQALPKGIYSGILPIIAKRDNNEISKMLINVDIVK